MFVAALLVVCWMIAGLMGGLALGWRFRMLDAEREHDALLRALHQERERYDRVVDRLAEMRKEGFGPVPEVSAAVGRAMTDDSFDGMPEPIRKAIQSVPAAARAACEEYAGERLRIEGRDEETVTEIAQAIRRGTMLDDEDEPDEPATKES